MLKGQKTRIIQSIKTCNEVWAGPHNLQLSIHSKNVGVTVTPN